MSDISENLARFVPNVHYELIPIKELVSNQGYQRDLAKAHIKKTAKNFDLRQINPVKVSRRNGVNFVFDGQHTTEIVALVSGSRDTPVWCMVYDDLDYKSEAEIFANQQKFTKRLNAQEIFNANVEAGSSVQVTIKTLVESLGLKIGMQTTPGCIRGVGALEFIHNKYSFHMLEHVLMLCVATWEGNKDSMTASILKSMALVLHRYGDAIDDNTFKERLGRVSPKEIIRTAKERSGGTLGCAEAIILAYNKKVKNPLSLALLYGNKEEGSQSATEAEEGAHNEASKLTAKNVADVANQNNQADVVEIVDGKEKQNA